MTEQHFAGKKGEQQVEELLAKGLNCDNEITVGDAVDCFMHVLSFMHDKIIETGLSIDESLMSVACSYIATLMNVSKKDMNNYMVM